MQIEYIKQVADAFHKRTGWDYDELFSEASLAYAEAMKYFNPEMSTEFFFATTCMRNWLVDYWFKVNEPQDIDITSLPLRSPYTNAEESLDFTALLFSYLSKDARKVCEIVFQEYDTIFTNDGSAKSAKRRLREKLRQTGWKWPKIWKSFREIKKALNKIA